MVDLARVYTDLGYLNAVTFIASGNVIFSADHTPDRASLEAAFAERFGFESEVFLRTELEIKSLMDIVPWSDDDGVTEVSFLERPPDAQSARSLEATAVEPEALMVIDREVLFLRVGGGAPTIHKESTSMRILEMAMTRRGMATVRKIDARFLS